MYYIQINKNFVHQVGNQPRSKSDRYCFGDCTSIKEDDNRCSILHRQRGLEIAENIELAKLK
jgi:hypothetical protein